MGVLWCNRRQSNERQQFASCCAISDIFFCALSLLAWIQYDTQAIHNYTVYTQYIHTPLFGAYCFVTVTSLYANWKTADVIDRYQQVFVFQTLPVYKTSDDDIDNQTKMLQFIELKLLFKKCNINHRPTVVFHHTYFQRKIS